MAWRRSPRDPAVLASIAVVLIVVGVVSVMWLKVLPDCWRDHPTWSVAQCVDDWARAGGPFAPPRPPVPKPVVPPAPQLTLNWVDNSAGQAGFRIERKTGTGGAYAMVAELPAGTTSYVDAAVASGTTYCYRVKAFNEAGESGFTNENCATVASTFALGVSVSGSGTVTSSPAGINCGSACTASFANGTLVTLAATAASGSAFTGWSGGGCSGTDPCSLTGSGPVTVSATFGAATQSAAVTLRIVGEPATGPYSVEAQTTVAGDIRVEFWVDGALRQTENNAPYYLFGDTSGTPILSTLGAGSHLIVAKVFAQTGSTVQAESQTTVTEGAPAPAAVTLTVSKTGEGTVVSSPTGITCGADCTESYASGTAVTLSALPSAGSTFGGWSGGGCSGTAPCTVSMTVARAVTATFAAAPPPPPPPPPPPAIYTLSVSVSGQGTVVSAPAGITCGSDCTEGYASGTAVALSAQPNAGWSFRGWTGACSGTGSCTVTMTAASSVTATFGKERAKR